MSRNTKGEVLGVIWNQIKRVIQQITFFLNYHLYFIFNPPPSPGNGRIPITLVTSLMHTIVKVMAGCQLPEIHLKLINKGNRRNLIVELEVFLVNPGCSIRISVCLSVFSIPKF